MCAEGSVAAGKQSSGRNVAHSRRGCLTCKKRKLRCPENKPVCERCWNDNKTCRYEVQLQWEDESRKRGIKHGRATRVPAPSSSHSWVEIPVRRRVEHFINTTVCDLEDEIAMPSSPERSLLLRGKFSGPGLLLRPRSIPNLQPGQDGRLFDYYLQRVCENMTLVDYSSNAFRRIILPLSLNNELVMQMVLALGALALSAAGQDDLYAVALRHKHRSIQLLRHNISEPEMAASDHNLISVLMLCVFDISDNCQASWSTHLSAAVDLMRLQTGRHNMSMITPSVSEFVSRFFLVRDALGRSACGKRAKIKELPSLNSDEIDHSIGCSYELIDIISSITDLSREVVTYDSDFVTSTSWSDKTAMIESQLRSLTQRLPQNFSVDLATDGSDFGKGAGLSSPVILLRTSAFIHTAAKLYFNATLRSADPSAPQTKKLVNDAIELIRPLAPMHLRSAHLWPLFVASIYAIEDEDRVFFLDQFNVLERYELSIVAAGSVARVREIVETVWKRRDIGEHTSHMTVPEGVQMPSDWARYVQPMSEGLSLG